MTIKKVDNRSLYCDQYWQLLEIKHRLDPDLFEAHKKVDQRIACTINKKFVYGFGTSSETYTIVRKHNNNLSKIKRQCAMSLNRMVQHYNLCYLEKLTVGINYTSNIAKYTISFKEFKEDIIQFTFNHLDELEDKIKQYCNQIKLYKLITDI